MKKHIYRGAHYYSLFLLISILVFSCENQNNEKKENQNLANGNKSAEIKPGSICTVEYGDGKFGIIKVLVMENEIIHLKLYKNKYDQRPSKIDINELSLGSMKDKDGEVGIGHIPLDIKGFYDWKPIPIAFEQVAKDELEGYEIWKSQ